MEFLSSFESQELILMIFIIISDKKLDHNGVTFVLPLMRVGFEDKANEKRFFFNFNQYSDDNAP
jgi:hypothetical protein